MTPLTQALPIALAIVRAFNPHLGDVADAQRAIYQGPTMSTMVTNGPFVTRSTALAQYSYKDRTIIVNYQLQDPAVMAALLAHELTHASDGPLPAAQCLEYEARAAQESQAELEWFTETFGAPHPDMFSPDGIALGAIWSNTADQARSSCSMAGL